MSIYQGSGIRRNGSPVTGYRQDRLPFGLDRSDAVGGPRGPVRLVSPCPQQRPMGFYSVRLCPRAEARMCALLAFPGLDPDVRGVFERLLAWAESRGAR